MASELLVDNWINDGRKLIVELSREGFDVSVALWIKSGSDGSWSLFVGSLSFQSGKSADAYRTLYTCLSRIPESELSLFTVKFIHSKDPIAKDAIAVRDRHPESPTRCHDRRFGSVFADDAYIYPKSVLEVVTPGFLEVDAVTDAKFDDSKLRVTKVKLTIPKQSAVPSPGEWISGIKCVNGKYMIEKVKLKQSADGLCAEYVEEPMSECPP